MGRSKYYVPSECKPYPEWIDRTKIVGEKSFGLWVLVTELLGEYCLQIISWIRGHPSIFWNVELCPAVLPCSDVCN